MEVVGGFVLSYRFEFGRGCHEKEMTRDVE